MEESAAYCGASVKGLNIGNGSRFTGSDRESGAEKFSLKMRGVPLALSRD